MLCSILSSVSRVGAVTLSVCTDSVRSIAASVSGVTDEALATVSSLVLGRKPNLFLPAVNAATHDKTYKTNRYVHSHEQRTDALKLLRIVEKRVREHRRVVAQLAKLDECKPHHLEHLAKAQAKLRECEREVCRLFARRRPRTRGQADVLPSPPKPVAAASKQAPSSQRLVAQKPSTAAKQKKSRSQRRCSPWTEASTALPKRSACANSGAVAGEFTQATVADMNAGGCNFSAREWHHTLTSRQVSGAQELKKVAPGFLTSDPLTDNDRIINGGGTASHAESNGSRVAKLRRVRTTGKEKHVLPVRKKIHRCFSLVVLRRCRTWRCYRLKQPKCLTACSRKRTKQTTGCNADNSTAVLELSPSQKQQLRMELRQAVDEYYVAVLNAASNFPCAKLLFRKHVRPLIRTRLLRRRDKRGVLTDELKHTRHGQSYDYIHLLRQASYKIVTEAELNMCLIDVFSAEEIRLLLVRAGVHPNPGPPKAPCHLCKDAPPKTTAHLNGAEHAMMLYYDENRTVPLAFLDSASQWTCRLCSSQVGKNALQDHLQSRRHADAVAAEKDSIAIVNYTAPCCPTKQFGGAGDTVTAVEDAKKHCQRCIRWVLMDSRQFGIDRNRCLHSGPVTPQEIADALKITERNGYFSISCNSCKWPCTPLSADKHIKGFCAQYGFSLDGKQAICFRCGDRMKVEAVRRHTCETEPKIAPVQSQFMTFRCTVEHCDVAQIEFDNISDHVRAHLGVAPAEVPTDHGDIVYEDRNGLKSVCLKCGCKQRPWAERKNNVRHALECKQAGPAAAALTDERQIRCIQAGCSCGGKSFAAFNEFWSVPHKAVPTDHNDIVYENSNGATSVCLKCGCKQRP